MPDPIPQVNDCYHLRYFPGLYEVVIVNTYGGMITYAFEDGRQNTVSLARFVSEFEPTHFGEVDPMLGNTGGE